VKILLLEDDPIISDIVLEFLISNGDDVDYAFDISEAQEKIQNRTYELFLFDVNVPDGNGFELLDALRQLSIETPAIFMTILDDIASIQKGFKSGCDDYIKKPFELEELEVRINNIKRIYNLGNQLSLGHGISLDRLSNQLTVDGVVKHLSKKEALILHYLVQHHAKTVSINELCTNLWEYESMPMDATIRTYIKTLRSILGEGKIETIKGVGYRFIKS
jgi:two-component system OmpR family response regulator